MKFMRNILEAIWHKNSSVPRSQIDYITQVSEKSEGWVTKKLSQEFSRTENPFQARYRVLTNFSWKIQAPSGTAPETSRNAYGTNQGTNEDVSQSDLHPEAGVFRAFWHETLAKEKAMMWRKEFTRKLHTAPPVHLQENGRKTTLPVNCNSAVRIPLRQ